jgi:hypothetical protein
MFALLLALILGFCGLAIEITQTYNRKIELQSLADAAALAAARQLNGTAAGINRAVDAAAEVAEQMSYQYNTKAITWSSSALAFAEEADPADGDWLSSSEASADPVKIQFAKIDTSQLDQSHGLITTIFVQLISPALQSMQVSTRAIAGRTSINLTPMAVCAMSDQPATSRNGELVQYGFRRGVAYDLMQLNPFGTTPENFLINPFAPAGTTGAALSGSLDMVKPYVCTGTMAIPQVSGGTITVERPFPLASLYQQLNSRFGTYTSPCTYTSAPPDANVKPYPYTSIPWMTTIPAAQTAQSTTVDSKLWTVADPNPSPGGTTGPAYGPLWSYAKAAQYSAYSAGADEPSNGYATYSASSWATLYTPGTPAPKFYPTKQPYLATSGANFQAPPGGLNGLRHRRVLAVPLLQCPVPAGANASASVVAVAKFFMTVPATSTQLPVEFAGVMSQQAIGGEVVLYP